MCAATVPMEFSFGTEGNLKSARRLRNLDLKRNRPTVHPIFGNTGSVVQQAYAAGASFKPAVTPPSQSAKVPSPVGGKASLPLKSGNKVINQGLQQQTQQIVVPQQGPSTPTPTTPTTPPAVTTIGEPKGFFSSGKNVVLAGGGLIGFVLVIYMLFFNKGKGRKRRKSNGNSKGNKKARGRGRR
jgi:hypothetical protein